MDDVALSSQPLYPIEAEKSDEQKTIEKEQVSEDYQLAALKDHPGWLQIRKQMEDDIDAIKSFKGINMQQYKDAELGQVVRTERMVASKLEEYLNKIDNAVRSVVESNGR